MYAIFQNGNKQYQVRKEQIVRLEKLNVAVGETIKFFTILMVINDKDIKIGTPFVDNSVIEAEVISHGRSKKIKIVKFHRRKHYRKYQGHRQWFTDVKITRMNF